MPLESQEPLDDDALRRLDPPVRESLPVGSAKRSVPGRASKRPSNGRRKRTAGPMGGIHKRRNKRTSW
ncbi:hypothetical protein Pla175_43840 [Pirellulimonas nuda]|uniref:Uncharacterized protein n=1 Tax=Pirellulimonas nuda TaxID=2528009 RepID=A0A518DHL9_9BACT|nr:hypothetical protein Pla175_43840 [Pirellulimonas nuda]